MASKTITNPDLVIGDVEALLIRAMGLRNVNKMNFHQATCWEQIKIDEVEKYVPGGRHQ